MKFDYMNALHMNKNNLDLFAEKCGISGEGLRYYIIKNGGFKLLLNDEDILEQVLEQLEKREFTVYIEFDPPKPQEVAVESDRVGKNATEKKKNKGKKKGRGNGKDKEGVVRNIFLRQRKGCGDMDEDDMDDADFLENDCGMDSVSGDDELYENFVDDVSAEMDSADETNSESSRDVVVSDNDMDEHRLSEDDENEPNFPVFNPVEMYNPSLELGMIFCSKKEFKKAVQSYAIKQKRSVKFTKNDSFRVYAVCSGGWLNVKTSWLSERYLQDFKSDPKRDVKGWRVDIMNQLRCHISRDQAYRAKRQALKKLEGSPEQQFTKLWDYAEELRRTNPGSTIILGVNDVNRMDKGISYEKIAKNREKASKKWKDTLCPKIKKLLQKNVDKIGDCIPIKANDRHYQISCYDGNQYSVDLEMRTCTCRIWQLSGIPCKHACSAIFNQNLQPEDMVHPYYNVDTYKQVYEHAILPISGQTLWNETGLVPPLPPNFGRGPGRPAGARNREPDEPNVKTTKKSCKKPIKLRGKSLDSLFSDHPTQEQRGASSSNHPRKRKHSVYQDPTRMNMTAAASGVSDQPHILPPIVEDNEPTEIEFTPEILTEAGPSQTQASVQGPTMFEQLQMAHTSMPVQPQMTLQPRLNIRHLPL
ncbi:hypothetical protein Sango_2061600 [Sesamum angolense]|uniref:SWIM-type domain-containing protein n=1 Tax=Sesamum angolense TaxID=2727404 RepID=A0AAE1WAX7_9LAMI|nr:hypothetical protein Sango_2061600 [Sesamum angolense]